MCVLNPEATRSKEIQPKRLSIETKGIRWRAPEKLVFHCGGEATSDLTELKVRFGGYAYIKEVGIQERQQTTI